MVIGGVFGFSAILLPALDKSISTEIQSWIVSIPMLANVPGAIAMGYISNKFGRRWSFIGFSIPLLVGWIVLIFSNGSAAAMIVGRFLCGFGMMQSICQLYTMELLSANIRPVLGVTLSVANSIGITITYALGMVLSWQNVCWVFVGITLASMALALIVPESPNWLAQQGQLNKAEDALKKLRGNMDISEELADLKAVSSDQDRSKNLSAKEVALEFTKSETYKPAILLIVLWALSQLSGNYAIISYAVDIFKSINGAPSSDNQTISQSNSQQSGSSTDKSQYVSAIIVGLMRLVSTLVGSVMVKRFTRRSMMVLSSTVMAVAMTAMSITSHFQDQAITAGVGWLPVVFASLFIFAFGIGMNTVPWLLMGELCPAKVRAVSSSICAIVAGVTVFIVTKVFPLMCEKMTDSGAYGFFAAVSAVSIVVSQIFIPRTEGKTLEELDALYAKKSDIITVKL